MYIVYLLLWAHAKTIKSKKGKNSVAGNRTRVSWVKARYPNRWTTTELVNKSLKITKLYDTFDFLLLCDN